MIRNLTINTNNTVNMILFYQLCQSFAIFIAKIIAHSYLKIIKPL